MYYSDEILEEVRSRNDIVDVIGSYVKLKKSGGTWFGLCPFHNEKTPSFSVTPNKQMFYCFGCHKGGSVITFVQQYENCSFQEAVQRLAARAGMDLPQEDLTQERKRANERRAQLFEINKAAGTFFYYSLRSPQGEAGLRYLQERQLSDETMKSFGLGFAGKQRNTLYHYLKKKGYSDELLFQSGLMSRDERGQLYDKFWNRVMFPIMDVNQRIIGFGGRVLGEGKPKYLNSPESDIFNKRRNLYGLYIARRSREDYLILCEGYMDVIALHQGGFTNAVASLGTALTQEHAALLRRYTQEVILSYDSDQAGINAALRAIPMLRENEIRVKILQLSPYKDPDEFLKALGPEALRERLENARSSFLFETDQLLANTNLNDPDEKTAFQQRVADKIASYELEAQRENYIEAAGREYGIGYDSLRQMVRQSLSRGVHVPAPRYISREQAAPDAQAGILTSQRMLLTWLTRFPSLFPVYQEYLSPEDFQEGVYRDCAALLWKQMEQGQISEAAIVDHFDDPQDQTQAAQLFHTDIGETDPAKLERAVKESIRKVAGVSMAAKDNNQDLNKMQRVIERKRKMEQLDRVRINFGEER